MDVDEWRHTGHVARWVDETDANVTSGYMKKTNLAAEISASFFSSTSIKQ